MRKQLTRQALLLLLFCSVGMGAFAQGLVSGKVIDASTSEPIVGATVVIEGTTNGVITDVDGNFSIEMNDSETLIISYVGYATQSIAYSSQPMTVQLAASSESLDAVMVVGYGSVKKKDATGSVVSLSEEDFNSAPSITAENLLQGRTTGVSISPNNGGAPGGGASIKIRGTGSLSLTTEPLIIVDDVPLSFGNIGGSRNILESINPNDIESMTILKDASATAIYGSRASNGVIIITTKEGKANQPLQVTVDSKLMVSSAQDYISVMDANQFTNFVNDYGSADNVALLGNSNTDWQDEIYRTAITSDNNVSVTGSLKGMPVRASLGYISQEGILETDKMNRFTSSLNLSPSFFDNHLKVELNGKYTYVENDFASRDAIGAAAAFDPTQSIYDEDGAYTTWYTVTDEGEKVRNYNTVANPLMLIHGQEDLSNVNRFIGNAKVDYKFHFLPELKATINVGYDRAWSDTETYKKDSWLYALPGQLTDDSNTDAMNKNKLIDIYLTYNNTFGDHRIDATGGYAYQSFYSESHTISQSTFEDPTKDIYNDIVPSINEDVLLSFFARANYSYKDKYLVTATVRADASSKLNPDDRWGFFPSASFGWRISEEDFIKESESALSNLKLRLGYGQMGNVGNLGNYQYLTRYSSSANNQAYYQLGDQYYNLYRPEVTNKDLSWEVGETYNAGIDIGFWDQRLTGTFDYYIKNTRDLIASQRLDPFTNFGSTVSANIGDIRNEGVEMSISYDVFKDKAVSWNVGANASYNKNEITHLPNEELVGDISRGTGNKVQLRREGEAANSFYVYEQAYDSNGMPLEDVFVDRNNDGQINESDRYIYNNADPSWVFGLFTSVNYKNWDLAVTARANLGTYSYYDAAANNIGIAPAFAHTSLSNRNTFFYKAPFQNVSDQEAVSDMFIQNSSFFKLDNITLGYRIPKSTLKFADLRLYGSVQNVFTITDYEGVDPENGGIDGNFYPIPTIYTFGLTLNL